MTNWKEIHPDFTEELQKEWEDRGFSYEECKKWLDIGMKTEDVGFCAWLRDIEKRSTEWVLNHEDIKELREEYQNYDKSNAQKWLDKWYPKEGGCKIKEKKSEAT